MGLPTYQLGACSACLKPCEKPLPSLDLSLEHERGRFTKLQMPLLDLK